MRRFPVAAILLFFAAPLAGCGGAPSAGSGGAVSQGPTTIVPDRLPIDLYTDIARNVNACWMNAARPVFTNHESRADAPATGVDRGSAKLAIYERTPDGQRGLKVFSISFEPRGRGTVINSENLKLPYPLGQKLMSDVGYWAQGGQGCDAASAPAAPGPQPRRGSL
ncbi:MAG: hypothetical protein AB7G34_08115 [Hyphomicrobiales bacterium]